MAQERTIFKQTPMVECSIISDVCPYYKENKKCNSCDLYKEYSKAKRKAKKIWENFKKERINEEEFIY